MECGRDAEEVRPSRRAEGLREIFGVALEEGFGDDEVAADDGVGVAVGTVVDRWVERVGDVVLAAINGGVGKGDCDYVLAEGGFGEDEGGGEVQPFVNVMADYEFQGFVVLTMQK